jgi:hypothetical protein
MQNMNVMYLLIQANLAPSIYATSTPGEFTLQSLFSVIGSVLDFEFGKVPFPKMGA